MKTSDTNRYVTVLRMALGWLFLYAGAVKVLDPEWSAQGYLKSAKTFSALYTWFAGPDILPVVNFINEWGLTLLGISLILGLCVRLSSFLGVALMAMYYFPILSFPYVDEHYFLIDTHVIFALVLLLLAQMRAGRVFGLDAWLSKTRFCKTHKRLCHWLG